MGKILEEIIANPKTSFLAVATTNFSNWWIDWGSPIISAVSSILSIVLLVVLIRYHLQNTKKLIRENETINDSNSVRYLLQNTEKSNKETKKDTDRS